MPMLQNFHYVDHVERSPCHKSLLAPSSKRAVLHMSRTKLVDTPPFDHTLQVREYLNDTVREYLNADPSHCGIT